jgi:hypothetical protein
MDANRQEQIEQVIRAFEAEGRPWSNLMIYDVVGGQYAALSQYLKARRAGGGFVEPSPGVVAEAEGDEPEAAPVVAGPEAPLPVPRVPLAPLAAAQAAWVSALANVAQFEQRLRPRDRAEDAAYQATGMMVNRAFIAAEQAWRPLELAARNAVATFLAHQAQLGRGSAGEQGRCREGVRAAQAALRWLVGAAAPDPLVQVQALLVPPVIDGKRLLPPLI